MWRELAERHKNEGCHKGHKVQKKFPVLFYASCGLRLKNKFWDFEFGRTEVDEQTVSSVGRSHVAEDLRDMFVRQSLAGFDFNDQAILDEAVGLVIAQSSSVFIGHAKGSLLRDSEALFAQPVCKAVFINLLQVTVAQIAVKGESGFADWITQVFDFLVSFHVRAKMAKEGTNDTKSFVNFMLYVAKNFQIAPGYWRAWSRFLRQALLRSRPTRSGSWRLSWICLRLR